MSKRAVASPGAPKAVGPYSQAIVAGGFVFCSGQIPLDPISGKLVESEDVAAHVRRAMDNLQAALEAAGSGLDKLVKVTIFMADMRDYLEVNKAYAAYAGDVPPARTAVQVAMLPLKARVEIEAIALA